MSDERITPEEMRDFMTTTHESLEALDEKIETIRAGLQTASQPAAGKSTILFDADEITLDYMDGKPVYKFKGNEYRKYGVRVWPEVLEQLEINAETLKPGTTKLDHIIPVMVKMIETKDAETGEVRQTPRKVIGRA